MPRNPLIRGLAAAGVTMALLLVSHALSAAEPEILSVKPGIKVEWQSEVGKAYRLWWSDQIDGGAVWEAVGRLANGDGQFMSEMDVGDEERAGILDTARRFYKLEVRSAIGCNLSVKFDRTASGAPLWLYTSRVGDPTSYVPITVTNDGCVTLYCVNVELYWTSWNGCSNIYRFYAMDSCRLAKLSIRKIESMSSVTVKIPWQPKQNCNSMKVRVDPDNKDLDPWGAPIPCYWHNPAYPLGHVIEPDDCNFDDVPDPLTGKPANDNWDSTKGNIPRLRPKWFTIIPLPIPNPRYHPWVANLEVDEKSLAVYRELFPGITVGFGTPTAEVEKALMDASGQQDIDVLYPPETPLSRLVVEGRLATTKETSCPIDKITMEVMVVQIPGPIPDPPPEIMPEFLVRVKMAEWYDTVGQIAHPGHVMLVLFLPYLELVQ